MLNFEAQNQGEFKEASAGQWFHYRPTANGWALAHGLTHEIETTGGLRFATVKKTVCEIATDEDEFGDPVCEKWHLAKHHTYTAAAHA